MFKNFLAAVGAGFLIYHGAQFFSGRVQQKANERADERFNAFKQAWLREKENAD